MEPIQPKSQSSTVISMFWSWHRNIADRLLRCILTWPGGQNVRPVTCVSKSFSFHLIGSELGRRCTCLAKALGTYSLVIEIWEGHVYLLFSDMPSRWEWGMCPLAVVAVINPPRDESGQSEWMLRVEATLRMPENRVMPGKGEREKEKECQVEVSFIPS